MLIKYIYPKNKKIISLLYIFTDKDLFLKKLYILKNKIKNLRVYDK